MQPEVQHSELKNIKTKYFEQEKGPEPWAEDYITLLDIDTNEPTQAWEQHRKTLDERRRTMTISMMDLITQYKRKIGIKLRQERDDRDKDAHLDTESSFENYCQDQNRHTSGNIQKISQEDTPQYPGNARRGQRYEYLIGQRIEAWVRIKTETEKTKQKQNWVEGDWMIARVQAVNENGTIQVQWPDKKTGTDNIIDPKNEHTYPVQKMYALEEQSVTDMEGHEMDRWTLKDEEEV